MSSIIKKLVSTPTRSVNNDYDIQLDLSYITKRLLVCSGPVSKYPKTFYRNSLNDLTTFLKINHKDNWCMWNFKSEDLDDYSFSDKSLRNKLYHFPWPDHEAPPFQLIIDALESIGHHLRKNPHNVAVIHCKMGKGRSGLITVAYLMIYLDMPMEKACQLFTEKRMHNGFGEGVSIQSQLRYVSYCTLYKSLSLYAPQFSTIIDHIRVLGPFDMKLKFEISGYMGDVTKTFCELDDSNVILKKNECYIYGVGQAIPCRDVKITIGATECLLVYNSVSLWFNTYWELLIGGVEEEKFKKHIIRFSWEQVDGFKGTSLKGNRLFDFIEIYLTLI